VAFLSHAYAERIANEDYSDLEVRVGFELTRAAAGIADCHQALLHSELKFVSARCRCKGREATARLSNQPSYLSHTKVFLDDHSLLK